MPETRLSRTACSARREMQRTRTGPLRPVLRSRELDKPFFLIRNFLDAKAWIAENLGLPHPKVPGSNPGPATIKTKGLR